MKNKVLVIGALPPPTGGMGTVMEQMTKMDSNEYDLIFMNVSKSKLIKYNIVFNIVNYMFRCVKLFFIIIFEKPKIVHIHMASGKDVLQKYYFFRISRLINSKIILHMHGARFKEYFSEVSTRKQKRIKNFCDSVDALIVLSESWKEYYSKITNNKNIFVVRNAVEEIEYNHFKRIYPKESVVVLFLGYVCERKGAYDLLKIINQINVKNIKFVFVGPYEDKAKFFKMIDKLKVRSKCEFIGEVVGEDRFKYYASADIFVLPSYAEGLPVALLEAMSFGLPIISTTVGAIPEVIKKENGILITAGDTKVLAKAITSLGNNHKLMKYYGLNNSKVIQKNYTQKIFVKNIENIYNKISHSKNEN